MECSLEYLLQAVHIEYIGLTSWQKLQELLVKLETEKQKDTTFCFRKLKIGK